MKPKIVFLMALLVFLLAAPALAVNMTISEMGFSGPQTVQIYANGTLLGTYNTTANGIDLPDQDFILVLKPEASAYLRSPPNLLAAGFDFVETNFVAIMFVFFLVSIIWFGRRR